VGGASSQGIDFERSPDTYRHWQLAFDGCIATLTMAVDPTGGLRDGYELKLNSYDLGVDIELHDAVQRLRFEHPEVKVVVVTGALDKVFCAGANIQMLATSSHSDKVNFCKFTNETRCEIEDATSLSGQTYIAAVNGTAAGGGYELALACDEIVLVDDRSSAVSLPEVPLLAVLPGTGGLTRLVDKRHVRRDLADVFATRVEGVRGSQAVEWGLVDLVAPPSTFAAVVARRAAARAADSRRPDACDGIALTPLRPGIADDGIAYSSVSVTLDRAIGAAHITVHGPAGEQPLTAADVVAGGDRAWILAAARELDDAVLRLRFNEPSVGTWVLHTRGDNDAVAAAEAVLVDDPSHWLVNEVRLLWARVLRRLDLSARTIVAVVEPGSCFTGVLAELVLAADRSFMLDADGTADLPAPRIRLTTINEGWLPMSNRLSRLESRFWGRGDDLERALGTVGCDLDAGAALAAGLITFAPDDLDWDDEIRMMLEERNSFSPDALTAMECNYRFVGPETMETKIFGRLTAWQNWVFQRPNAIGADGALQRFGTGTRPTFDRQRV
jgi:benzoyl-CoA-dihydrodiol lyase